MFAILINNVLSLKKWQKTAIMATAKQFSTVSSLINQKRPSRSMATYFFAIVHHIKLK
jgi:hypothetical protein